jgi:hypothetical protein
MRPSPEIVKVELAESNPKFNSDDGRLAEVALPFEGKRV